eukprot:CAMPEP_0176215288 /NCGR_PEP_ID=MMETSP0121_2-20121125/16603_1 /TAXON_ID=160619 /ORGANISM="Kryptoperidinium foliaceum, Strain CCMP 1326" /LENGTH=265 /DNA_ID=CAMNT_0017554389 /DNA_START=72 /DNA_END=867 /DNA_ORIENTATION=+
MRKFKHHESKLLKKVNFYDWKSTRNVVENRILENFMIEDREDYTKYNKLAHRVSQLSAALRKMKPDDPDRIKMTEVLLNKLYAMGVIANPQSLEDCTDLPASKFCARRFAVVVWRTKFVRTLKEAVDLIKQGHFRIGPDRVSNPALHVTREMEDHIAWAIGSKVKKAVEEYKDEMDDFVLMGIERPLRALGRRSVSRASPPRSATTPRPSLWSTRPPPEGRGRAPDLPARAHEVDRARARARACCGRGPLPEGAGGRAGAPPMGA